MAGLAVVDPQWAVLKNKWAGFVGMAIDAPFLGSRCQSGQRVSVLDMDLVAVGTFHRAFADWMVEGLSKRAQSHRVAGRAEIGLFFSKQPGGRAFLVDTVATETGDVVFGVARRHESRQDAVPRVARKTARDRPLGRLVGETDRQVVSARFNMFGPGPMAVFALDGGVNAGKKGFLDLVAGQAGFTPHTLAVRVRLLTMDPKRD